jgi:preprotein translocase subunit SecG
MDLSAFIVIIVMTALFFGFILWLAIYSRRTNPEEPDASISETRLKGD